MSDANIVENLHQVREQIATAAQRAGRQPNDVQLIAVSKLKPFDDICAAVLAGQHRFGENYAQELADKIRECRQSTRQELMSLEWHFIGALQSNKAKLVVGQATLIHSVDRVSLAQEISRLAVAQGHVQSVLIQLNIGDEQSKSGVAVHDADPLVERLIDLPGLKLRGVMALPPLTESESQARLWFATAREVQRRLREKFFLNSDFDVLSLGTTGDFEWAIQEGATLVRVGTAIFGERS